MRNLSFDPDSLAARPLNVDGVEFMVAPLGGRGNAMHMLIVKPMAAIETYQGLLAKFDSPRIVELGIAYGGSVGFLALTARPTRLVAIELADARVELLDTLIAERNLESQVRLFYGTDQADVERLSEIVQAEFADEPLDLVIDDASHLYDPSVATFECLFPRLRAGGQYIIEDWSCDHGIRTLLSTALADQHSPYHQWAQDVVRGRVPSGNAGQPPQSAVAVAALGLGDSQAGSAPVPLSRLAAQLALGPAESSSGIASVTSTRFWLSVERSDCPLDANYSLADACPDYFGTLAVR